LCAERKIDAIYTTLPPFSSMFVGHDLRLETGLPCGSPITATSGMAMCSRMDSRMAEKLELRMERRLLKAADRGGHRFRAENGVHAAASSRLKARWETLTNGCDTELYGDRPCTRPFTQDTVEFVYTGRLFKNRRGYAFAVALGRIHRSDPSWSATSACGFWVASSRRSANVMTRFSPSTGLPIFTTSR
jgi:hypothetical protein